jgi:DMSO reductase family type II enzyme heme b subunit
MGLLPSLFGYYAYTQAAAKAEAPAELRAVHPAPPVSISFRGKTIDIQGLENPLRKDTANFNVNVAEGAAIYVKNCLFCHGDNLDGAGHFAHAFNPPPANFTDPGTIAMLQEAYLFWRIAKGGPGLPKESSPWNSVMPAWEDRLTEEEIWKVILYLYDATGYQPRRWETQAAGAPAVFRRQATGLSSLAEAQQPGDAAAGKAIYDKRCALCHGAEGKGDGPGAVRLAPRPRDFTRGLYKIRTSPTGNVPTDQDLFKVITEGMPGTSMPAWNVLPEKERWTLVAYLKTFAPDRFKEPPHVVDLPREVASSKESIARGKEMFEAIECNKCHGNGGRGDGPSAPELKDDWGNPIRPANLTKVWTFRGGASTREIATRLAAGLMGTPMPSFAEAIEKPEDIWHLANYVKSLGPERPHFATILSVEAIQGEIPEDPEASFWLERVPVNFPLAGQVVVDPRNFNPSIDMITVRAVYSDTEIAFHLTWDDPTASKPGPGGKTFADQVALQFPARLTEGAERPYILMGESANPVYLLRWISDGGVGEANATGIGKLVPQKGDTVHATGKVRFADGRYRLVMRRARVTKDSGDLEFPVGRFLSVAFMAWDGGNGEAASRMSLSSWYYLLLEPPPSRARWVYPPLVALGVLGLELWGLRWARRSVRR